ncbi:response regulator [Ectopseudomonas oleovorans]|uniref:response regulator transcription factor n=1 Tax=Ectopseudomonas oleovorans TaxID=301 RepID=UPI00241C380E|nr:response regulator transcription factor [Pseudomonas oleovorans]
MSSYRIVIADDHPLFRDALKHALQDSLKGLVVEEAGSFDGVVSILDADNAYDLILLDLRLPDEPGIELLQRWLARGESTPVAILSASDSALEAQAALAAGALGFIPKSSDGNALRQAVTRVLLGETLPAPSSSSPLTPRQLEILQLLAEGLPNKAISRELGLAEDTVKTHLKALFETFAVHTRTACVSAARQRGWL